jgi:hypothetical protein
MIYLFFPFAITTCFPMYDRFIVLTETVVILTYLVLTVLLSRSISLLAGSKVLSYLNLLTNEFRLKFLFLSAFDYLSVICTIHQIPMTNERFKSVKDSLHPYTVRCLL